MIGVGVGNRVPMREHPIYRPIPRDGCVAITERDASKGVEAAGGLRLSVHDAVQFGVVDEIVAEPLGGAHRNAVVTAAAVQEGVEQNLNALEALPTTSASNSDLCASGGWGSSWRWSGWSRRRQPPHPSVMELRRLSPLTL